MYKRALVFGRNWAGKLVFCALTLSRFAVSMKRDGRKEVRVVMKGKEFGRVTLVKPR